MSRAWAGKQPQPPLMPDAAYWRRTLRPWKGENVKIGLHSGRVATGRLVDVDAEGPILEVGETRQRPCTWQEIRSVETADE